MVDSKGFILCPVCHNKTRQKVRPDTTFKNFPLFCPRCRRVTLIDMGPGNQIKRI